MKEWVVVFRRHDAVPTNEFGTKIKGTSIEDAQARLAKIAARHSELIYDCVVEGEYVDGKSWEDMDIDTKIEFADDLQNLDCLDYLFVYEQRDLLNPEERKWLVDELTKRELYEFILSL